MSLKRKQILKIIIVIKDIKNTTDQRLSNIKKNKFTEDIVAAVVTADEDGYRQTLPGLASVLGQRKDTIKRILSSGLGLVKKFVLWVPKLLNEGQKKDTVGKCNHLLKLAWSVGLGVLDKIRTKDELSVSLHTPETKQHTEQSANQGLKCHVKAKVHGSKTKSLAMVIFDSKVKINTNNVPKETMVYPKYIRIAL
jgi:hypothetical protein